MWEGKLTLVLILIGVVIRTWDWHHLMASLLRSLYVDPQLHRLEDQGNVLISQDAGVVLH